MRISIDTGESDGYAFVLDYKGKKIKIKGDVIFISQLGTFYISNRNNTEYEVKRKFKIIRKMLLEKLNKHFYQ